MIPEFDNPVKDVSPKEGFWAVIELLVLIGWVIGLCSVGIFLILKDMIVAVWRNKVCRQKRSVA